MSIAGRKRKQRKRDNAGDIRISGHRTPSGRVREERTGPHERHLEIRTALGFTDRDTFEQDNPLYYIKWLTKTQRDAGLKFDSDYRAYLASIGCAQVCAASVEPYSRGKGHDDEERDARIRDTYICAHSCLTDSGQSVVSIVEKVVCYRNMPMALPKIKGLVHGLSAQEEDLRRGLDALAWHYGMVR